MTCRPSTTSGPMTRRHAAPSRDRKPASERKRRAPSNRIGERGEKKFDAAAADHGLLAAPIKNDYGFDFLCQVDEDHDSAGSSGLSGGLVGVSVRTTANAAGRIKLDRADARALLAAQFASMVALVHLPKKGAESISVRVLDEAFRNKLGAFLLSERDTVSFTPVDFAPIANVRRLLAPALEPGFVLQSRLASIMSGLEPHIPGMRLAVEQDSTGSWTVVTADNLFSLFAGELDDRQDPRYLTAFGSPSRMPNRLRELDVTPRLVTSLDGLPKGLVIIGATEHEDAEWTVVDDDGSADCILSSAETPQHTGWRHAAGWSLVISRPVLHAGVYVHELKAFADPDEELALGSKPDLNAFLLRCGRTARVGRKSWGEQPLAAWDFEDMPRYNMFAQWLADAAEVAPAGTHLAFLRDAHDDDTMRALHWLSALQRDPANPGVRLGFMLGDAEGAPDQPCELRLPVLLATAQTSLLVELRCQARIAVGQDGGIAGLQIERVQHVSASELADRANTTHFPEFVLHSGLGIALTDSGWDVVDGADYPDGVCRFEVLAVD